MLEEQMFGKKEELPEVLEIRKRITEEFKDLIFEEGPHKYYLNGVELPSVSHVTHQFAQPFDEAERAEAYALKNGMTPQYWLDEWHYKALCATTTGTQVHAYGESLGWLINGHPEKITPDQLYKYNPEKGWLVPTRPKERAVLKFYKDLHPSLHFVMAEAKVYTGKNRALTNLKQDFAGTFDMLFYYKDPVDDGKNGLCIFDYKGLPLDTPILTTDGWKTMGTISEGNEVFDENGMPTKVLHCSDVHHNKCYNIRFDNGDSIVADYEHRWKVFIGLDEHVVTTEEIKSYMDSLTNDSAVHSRSEFPYIPCCQPISSHIWTDKAYEAGKAVADGRRNDVPKNFILWEPCYRMEMLSGIMDSRGSSDMKIGIYLYRADYKWQADMVVQLVSSLGYKTTRTGQQSTSVIFTMKTNPFKYRAHGDALINPLKTADRRIIAIDDVDMVPTRCIEVESSCHTFCVGYNFLVTHNTNADIYKEYSRSHNKMMLPPFDDMYDEAKSNYTLQLSSYALPLEDIGYKVIARRLVWLKDDETYELIPLPDVTDRLRAVL